MRTLNLESWPRLDHYRFFRDFDRPFFGVCADIDVTKLQALSRSPDGPRFFLACLWFSLRAANEVEELRMRIRGDEVVVHEVVHGGSTVLRDDETFGFGYFPFDEDFDRFAAAGERVLEETRKPGPLSPRSDSDDLIHHSVLPWIHFTAFSHARQSGIEDSVPKVVLGRYREREGRLQMPVSVEAHHALVDGLHVGRFLTRFQELVNAVA